MSTWEERMSAKAKARLPAPGPLPAIPQVLHGEGDPGTARVWCTECGLPDAPEQVKFGPPAPCPRCGSHWRWYGRLSDRDGTAAAPPDDGTCLECFEYRRYPDGQAHFGWAWWRRCQHPCGHAHHRDELWLASG